MKDARETKEQKIAYNVSLLYRPSHYFANVLYFTQLPRKQIRNGKVWRALIATRIIGATEEEADRAAQMC